MRRLAAITVLLSSAALLAAFVFGSSAAQGSGSSTFDVIFDDARGLIAGQLVKVAGAKAGTITNVTVTPDFKARIEASIDSQFMPFRANATCTIRPEGLIAENYVDCNPGSPPAAVLTAQGGHPPTVPVQNTTEPVSLLDLFNMFNLPTRERFQVIVSELGIGSSGEGQNLNDILRRANPALALARQVIAILNRQRNQLATIVDATNTIAAQGAGHTANVQNFLTRAAALSTLTASHSSNLSRAINELPGLLGAAQPALKQLDRVAVDGTPLVQQIHNSVPALNRVANDLGPFVRVARPGLTDLGRALRRAIPAIRDTTPLTRTLRSYTAKSLPGTELTGRLFANLQQHGLVENLLSIFYYVASSLARFDQTSHLLSVLLIGPDNSLCGSYATTPTPACSAHYGSAPKFTPSSRLARQAHGPRHSTAMASPTPHGATTTTTTTTTSAAPPPSVPAPTTTGSTSTTGATGNALGQALQNLLNFLTK
jgi:ABC-type transporter Mla subunit MlaD